MNPCVPVRTNSILRKAAVTAALCLLQLAAGAQGIPRPKLVFDSLTIELDTLYRTDSVKVFDIPFRNDGDATLEFYGIDPDCPCIHADYGQKSYPPHSKGVIHITIDLSIPPQEMEKGIFIYTNAGGFDKSTDIRFHGWLLADKDTPLEF